MEDCDLSEGYPITLHCEYLNIVMEHCYTCFDPPDTEVIICDGWDESDIRSQCDSPTYLASWSPPGNEL